MVSFSRFEKLDHILNIFLLLPVTLSSHITIIIKMVSALLGSHKRPLNIVST